MTEVPTSDWLAAQDDKTALKQAPALKGVARWHRKAGVVTHVFTHFPLELVVYTASVRGARARAGGHALGADCDARGRGAAECHAQGDRARAGSLGSRATTQPADTMLAAGLR